MGNRRRRIAAAALAATVAITLAGCSAINDVGRTTGAIIAEAAITGELDTATAALEKIPGVVVTQADHDIQPDYSFQVRLVASASAVLSEDDAHTVMEAVRRAFASDALRDQQASFQLESDTTPMSLDGAPLSHDQLAAELAYYFELATAYGSPLGMAIASNGDEHDSSTGYIRSIRSLGSEPPTARDLTGVVDTDSGQHEWEFPGFDASDSLPRADVFALVDSLSGVAPLLDYATSTTFTGVFLQWYGDTGIADVSLTSDTLTLDGGLAAAPDFALASQIATLSVESGTPVGQFTFAASDGSVFATVAPQCATAHNATELDQQLADALAPLAVVPGLCERS